MSTTDTTRAAVWTPTVAAGHRWTWRESVVGSTVGWRVAAGSAVVVAMVTTLSEAVPIASGVALALLVPPALVDAIERRLPNLLVLRAAVIAAGVEIITALTGGAPRGLGDPGSLVIGSVAMAAPLLALHLLSPHAMGLGDVKTAAVAGAAVGAIDPVVALLALAIGAAGGATEGLLRRQDTIAFGPALVGGSVAALCVVTAMAELDAEGWGAPT